MKKFDELLEKDVANYDGEFSSLIQQAPALYRLMTHLLSDRALPSQMSPLVIAAIAYFILPGDMIPEDKLGPRGYVDDIYLCAFVANEVMKASGTQEIIVKNWDGDDSVLKLINTILENEKELLGDKKNCIMEYIGYDQIE